MIIFIHLFIYISLGYYLFSSFQNARRVHIRTVPFFHRKFSRQENYGNGLPYTEERTNSIQTPEVLITQLNRKFE